MRDLIALAAAARLTRLINEDWLGEWVIVQPAKQWAHNHDGQQLVHNVENQYTGTQHWRTKLVSGLDCEHCVSVWTTFLTLAISRAKLPQPAAQLRDLLLGGLAGSYVVGHVVSRLDK